MSILASASDAGAWTRKFSRDLESRNALLKKEIASVRDFTAGKLAALSTAEGELKAVRQRLVLLLEANPGAEERMETKAKRDAAVQAARDREQEKQAQTRQGSAKVQALLDELKRGY